jgi:hypothetical protein
MELEFAAPEETRQVLLYVVAAGALCSRQVLSNHASCQGAVFLAVIEKKLGRQKI